MEKEVLAQLSSRYNTINGLVRANFEVRVQPVGEDCAVFGDRGFELHRAV